MCAQFGHFLDPFTCFLSIKQMTQGCLMPTSHFSSGWPLGSPRPGRVCCEEHQPARDRSPPVLPLHPHLPSPPRTLTGAEQEVFSRSLPGSESLFAWQRPPGLGWGIKVISKSFHREVGLLASPLPWGGPLLPVRAGALPPLLISTWV